MFRTLSTLVIAIALSTPVVQGSDVHWALCSWNDPDCICKDVTARSFTAGTYGTFFVSTRPLRQCSNTTVSGSELLKLYPETGSPPPSMPCCWEPPCGLPQCFTPLDELRDDPGPWIAVLDWGNWHGASVSWTVRAATDPTIKTVLFALDRPVVPGCPGVSDLSVLFNLAELASAAEFEPVSFPLAINMSFGRRRDDDDARNLICKEDTLSCQISLLLSHLIQPDVGETRTAVVAAAGNHRRGLFPAELEHVITAGSMDLEVYRDALDAVASWETPPLTHPASLMPGTALCLDGWPAPAGSSYSAGLFTGWLGEAILGQPAILNTLASTTLWQPFRACSNDDCEFLLNDGVGTFSTPQGRAGQLVYDALYADPALCGVPALATDSLDAAMVRVKPGSVELSSLVDLVASQYRQCPDSIFCLPCSMDCEEERRSKGKYQIGRIPIVLEIDLHASWKLDRIEIVALYIRMESEFFEVPLKADDLWRIGNGEIGYLNIKGDVLSTEMTMQPSLVSILRIDDGNPDTDDLFWSSTPVALR